VTVICLEGIRRMKYKQCNCDWFWPEIWTWRKSVWEWCWNILVMSRKTEAKFRLFIKIVGRTWRCGKNSDWWWDFGLPLKFRNKIPKSPMEKCSLQNKEMCKCVKFRCQSYFYDMKWIIQNKQSTKHFTILECLWQCMLRRRPNIQLYKWILHDDNVPFHREL
jgi:hypothetical protein